MLTALRGALGFLSRLPVGHDEDAWEAFRQQPVTIVLAGYILGVLLAPVFLLPGPSPTIALLYVVFVYLLLGITHLDGVADLGDAMVVHGDSERRRAVMSDTAVGTGGVLAVAIVVFGLGTAGLALATLPVRAAILVVVAEVGAKTGMALVVCLGSATHEGLGSAVTAPTNPRSVVPVVAVAMPAILLSWPRLLPAVAAMLGAGIGTVALFRWVQVNLGGINGDVIGATNEIARIVALHAGVIAWTLS